MQFIALDLETTGLNPSVDTIIEIAAIKCTLVKKGDVFCVEEVEEKTMLIDPCCSLEPEVSLITGITSQMLAGKKTWEEVREKVANFIGDLPIVGHNILFDKAVLDAHGIDVSKNIFLDTFEVSSILSIGAESLNLGFLANHYGISKRGKEHRALTDTWISVDLFCFYLTKISQSSQIERQIWNKTMQLTDDPCLKKIVEITGIMEKGNTELNLEDITIKEDEIEGKKQFPTNHTFHTYSILPPNQKEEKEFFESQGQTTIVTRNIADAKNLYNRLSQYEISSIIIPPKSAYISLSYLQESLSSNQKYSRKMTILITRLLFWREKKQSESLDGFRSYGEEYALLPQFRMSENENCNEYQYIWEQRKNTQISIITAHTFAKSNFHDFQALIFKDATLIEGILRQAFSTKISFTLLFEYIDTLNISPLLSEIRECIEIIEDMYLQTANRPTGKNPFPPGNFGETYVIEQKVLWKKMCTSLVLWTQKLGKSMREWSAEYQPKTKQEDAAKRCLHSSVDAICTYHHLRNNTLLALLSIRNESTSIQYISNTLTGILPNEKSKYMDYTVGNQSGNTFIEKTYQSTHIQEYSVEQKIIQRAHHKKITHKKTVILTTSLRHIREIHDELSSLYDHTFLVQGISGGKAKMFHNFKQESSAILIGLIESWRDMNELWIETEALFITKVPFDPPSDPYFLVKTKSMSNNFNEYSIPMVIARVNTLVGNARLANPNLKIFCSDKRLSQSKWGKTVMESLL